MNRRLPQNYPRHNQYFGEQSNELFRLAQSLNNQPVMDRLLIIEAVKQTAANHNYYQDQGMLGLHEIIEDTESSLRALSHEEQQNIVEIKEHYQHQIDSIGKENAAISDLRSYLEMQFLAAHNQSQRSIVLNKETQLLPLK